MMQIHCITREYSIHLTLKNKFRNVAGVHFTLYSGRNQLYVDILLTCGQYLHDRIISLRGDVLAYIPSFTPPHIIEVPVQSESERSCICVSSFDLVSVSSRFRIRFWNCCDIVVFFVFNFICIIN
jgi:hypothetical protein